jgi:hypothetical protein
VLRNDTPVTWISKISAEIVSGTISKSANPVAENLTARSTTCRSQNPVFALERGFFARPLRAPLYSTIVVAYTIVVADSFNLFPSFLTSVAHSNSRHQTAPLVPERSRLSAVSAVSEAGGVLNSSGLRLNQDGYARRSFRSVKLPGTTRWHTDTSRTALHGVCEGDFSPFSYIRALSSDCGF